jgi:hypothetical protein
MQQYTPQVRSLHKRLLPGLHISSFVNALKPQALGLASSAQFYSPIRFTVQICGGINAPAGAVRLDVPVHANPDWLETMKHRFATMINLPAKDVPMMDFRTVAGRSISTYTVDELPDAGKLNLYLRGHQVRLPDVPVMPIEYSVNKRNAIDDWTSATIKDEPLMERITTLLGACTSDQAVNVCIRGDGPVQQLIEKHLLATASSDSWAEFVRTHHMNSPTIMPSEEATKALKVVAKEILGQIQRFIGASEKPIAAYMSAIETTRLQKQLKAQGVDDTSLYEPVLGKVSAPGGGGVNVISGYDLFAPLVQGALSSPVLHQTVGHLIYNRPLGEGCKWDLYDKNRPLRRGGGGGGALAPPSPFVPGSIIPPPSAPIINLGQYRLPIDPAAIPNAAAAFSNLSQDARQTLIDVRTSLTQLLASPPAPGTSALDGANAALRTLLGTLYAAGQTPHTTNVAMRIAGLKRDDVTLEVLQALGMQYGILIPNGTTIEAALRMIAIRLYDIQNDATLRATFSTAHPVTLPENKSTSGMVADALTSAASASAGAAATVMTSTASTAVGLLSGLKALVYTDPNDKLEAEKAALVMFPEGPTISQKDAIALLRSNKAQFDKLSEQNFIFKKFVNSNATNFANFDESIKASFRMSILEGDNERRELLELMESGGLQSMKPWDFYRKFFGYTVQLNLEGVQDGNEVLSNRLHNLHVALLTQQIAIPDVYGMAFDRVAMQQKATEALTTVVQKGEEARVAEAKAADLNANDNAQAASVAEAQAAKAHVAEAAAAAVVQANTPLPPPPPPPPAPMAVVPPAAKPTPVVVAPTPAKPAVVDIPESEESEEFQEVEDTGSKLLKHLTLKEAKDLITRRWATNLWLSTPKKNANKLFSVIRDPVDQKANLTKLLNMRKKDFGWAYLGLIANLYALEIEGLEVPKKFVNVERPNADEEKAAILRDIIMQVGKPGLPIKLSADLDLVIQQTINTAAIEAHHPWNAQIHHTLMPMADGVYPQYYTTLHKKQNMNADAAYRGNLSDTYRAYHLFAGMPVSPPGKVLTPLAVSQDELAPPVIPFTPVACPHDRPDSDDEEEDLINSRAPDVIHLNKPIGISARPELKRFNQMRTIASTLAAEEVAADEYDFSHLKSSSEAFDD